MMNTLVAAGLPERSGSSEGGSRCPAVRLPDPIVQEARIADHDVVVVGASAGGVEAPARLAATEQATRRNL